MSKITLFDLENTTVDDKYTTKVSIPQYLPKGDKPSVYSLVDRKKYDSLMQEISIANISDEDKEFLRLAATRHIVFNYEKIADYYANSDVDVQELMEHSALVIIDLNDAIANGYTKLDKRLSEYGSSAYKQIHGEENGQE